MEKLVNQLNKELIDLYTSKYSILTKKINDYNISVDNKINRATNPLMLKVNNDWVKADLKVMVFGQENNIWGGEFGNDGAFCGQINEIINIYEKFYLNDEMYACPFWNEYRNLRNQIKKQDKNISFLWNNVVKIGRLGIGCLPEIHKITTENFNVISDEINILKPDVLIFFTGPNYDNKIFDSLGKHSKISIGNFNPRQICEIKFDTDYNLKYSIRTYHPGYLYRNKERKRIHIEELVLNVNKNI